MQFARRIRSISVAAASLCLVSLLSLWKSAVCERGANLKSGITRHIRSLEFPENSNMGLFFAVAIPIDIPDKSISLSWYFEANYALPPVNSTVLDYSYYVQYQKRSVDRRLLYDVIESKLQSYGYPGRACLLRAICEAAKFPFAASGLLGDVVRIMLTPSTSQKENLHPEIEEAEHATDCGKFEEKCPISLLDAITHSFG